MNRSTNPPKVYLFSTVTLNSRTLRVSSITVDRRMRHERGERIRVNSQSGVQSQTGGGSVQQHHVQRWSNDYPTRQPLNSILRRDLARSAERLFKPSDDSRSAFKSNADSSSQRLPAHRRSAHLVPGNTDCTPCSNSADRGQHLLADRRLAHFVPGRSGYGFAAAGRDAIRDRTTAPQFA